MALGKRKAQDECEDDSKPQEKHGSTLFVSNLPYNATSTDVQTLFSEIAPVRNAFVVCEHGTGVSKGVGYVSFAIREDAQMAYDKIAKEGITLVERQLRVQWAEQKPKVKKEKTETTTLEKREPPRKKARVPQPKAFSKPQDPLAIRTVVISGLPSPVDSKTLWKKIRKYQGAEKVEWPATTEGGEKDASAAHAVFSTSATAHDAITKLHAHVFKGSLLSVTLKKRLDTLASHKPSSKPSTPSYANRLIIRNLPFTATEQDLRSVFLPYGPIYSINMPLKEPQPTAVASSPEKIKPDNEQEEEEEEEEESNAVIITETADQRKNRNKGFAFVWFYSRKDAERAMEKCNGLLVRAGAAVELVKGKQKRKKEKRMEKKLASLNAAKNKKGKDEANVSEENVKGEEEEGDDDLSDGNDNGEKEEDQNGQKEDRNERAIAVDWALSKDRWEEEKAKIDEELKNEEEEVAGSDSDSENEGEGSESGVGEDASSDSEEGSSKENDDESEGEDDGDEDEDEDGDDDERGEDEKPTKPQLPQTEIGTTLFIRNISYDATEDELRTLFRSFGPLRYARITVDSATGRSRGTGFACFWNKEDADKVIQQSEMLRAETMGGNIVSIPKNPFSLPSILTPDPSSSLAHNLVLHGRALDVVRAVTRDEAGKLKEAGERAREKTDKRNMYLLREGVILPNSPEAASLSPVDLERRTKSYNSRRALLKSNPSLYVSKTRLSVRQIPIFVTDSMLKRLALHAVRAFEKEIKEGKRPELSAEELADPGGQPGQQEETTPAKVQQREHVGRDDASENESEAGGNSTAQTLRKKRQKAKLLKKLAQHKGTGVKQAKIVRQAERVDPITGKGRSRGYGFVEMYTHADALRLLRWANNNPDVHLLMRSWWREELERLIKIERERLKAGDGGDDDDDKGGARLKRMIAELEKAKAREEGKKAEGGEDDGEERTKTNRGTLIVEFSIENVQVVQKRNAIQKNRAVHKSEEEVTPGKKMLDDGQPSQRSARPQSISKDSSSPRVKHKRERETGIELEKGRRRSQKKRRLSESPSKNDALPGAGGPMEPAQSKDETEVPQESPRLGRKIGSIIGRKRMQRREKKGKRK